MTDANVKLDKLGRLLIPAGFRKKLGLSPQSRLILRLRNDRLELLTSSGAVAKAREIVRKHVSAKVRLTEALIQSRRKEAKE